MDKGEIILYENTDGNINLGACPRIENLLQKIWICVISRCFSSHSGAILLKIEENTPKPSFPSLRFLFSDRLLDVQLLDESVWLTQEQMGNLFGKVKSTISEHISNIFAEGELEKSTTVRNFRTVRLEGTREVVRNLERKAHIDTIKWKI